MVQKALKYFTALWFGMQAGVFLWMSASCLFMTGSFDFTSACLGIVGGVILLIAAILSLSKSPDVYNKANVGLFLCSILIAGIGFLFLLFPHTRNAFSISIIVILVNLLLSFLPIFRYLRSQVLLYSDEEVKNNDLKEKTPTNYTQLAKTKFSSLYRHRHITLVALQVIIFLTSGLLTYFLPNNPLDSRFRTISSHVFWLGFFANLFAGLPLVAIYLLVSKQFKALLLDVVLLAASCLLFLGMGLRFWPNELLDASNHHREMASAQEHNALVNEYTPDRDSVEVPDSQVLHLGKAYTYHPYYYRNYNVNDCVVDTTETIFIAESDQDKISSYDKLWVFGDDYGKYSGFYMERYSNGTPAPDTIVMKIKSFTDDQVLDSIIYRKVPASRR